MHMMLCYKAGTSIQEYELSYYDRHAGFLQRNSLLSSYWNGGCGSFSTTSVLVILTFLITGLPGPQNDENNEFF